MNGPDPETLLFETSGYSMWPFLRKGQKVVVKKTGVLSVCTGDILAYRKDSRIICHRVVEKKLSPEGKTVFCVRGDISLSVPEVIEEEAVLGKVVAVVSGPVKSRWDPLLKRLPGRLVVLLAPAVVLAVRCLKPAHSRWRLEK